MSQLWGEFEQPEPKDTVPAEVIKYIIMQAMQQDPLRSPPPHERVMIKPDPDASTTDTHGLEIDDRVIHSVKLIQYSKDIRDIIDDPSSVRTMFPVYPEHPIPPIKHKMNYPFRCVDKEFSDFTCGIGEEIPSISSDTARSVLSKSVAMLSVLSGFDVASQSVLATFTDAVEFFIQRIVMLLRVAVDQGANIGITGFPDPMERVFTEMGIGSVKEVYYYYQNRIMKRHQSLEKECQNLAAEFANFVPKVKKEVIIPKEERDEVPEIHLNDLCEDNGIEGTNALEEGYQMLESFEQEVRSQMDLQEEMKDSVNFNAYDFMNYKKFKQ